MKILIVSPRFPFAQGKADSMTVFYLIKYLHARKHKIILATFDNNERFSQEERTLLKDMCVETFVIKLIKWKVGLRMLANVVKEDPFQVAYYNDQLMKRKVDELVEKHQPDVIYAHLIRAAHYIKNHTNYSRVLAMQIAQTLNYRRLIQHERNWMRKIFYTSEYKRVTKMEKQVINDFDRLLLISPADTKAIAQDQASKKIFYSPHGIDVAYFSEDLKQQRLEDVIVMNGDFGTPTNIDGVLYFYNKIYPLIKATRPNIQLWLVGRNPVKEILDLAKDASVTVTGKVPDIRPYLQQATVGIAPLRAAAGLQNKILVSLASQLPLVATPIANEGISAPLGDVILVAEGPEKFAASILHLLNNKKERTRIGKNAIAYMEANWTWEFHFEKLESMMKQLAENRSVFVNNYYPF